MPGTSWYRSNNNISVNSRNTVSGMLQLFKPLIVFLPPSPLWDKVSLYPYTGILTALLFRCSCVMALTDNFFSLVYFRYTLFVFFLSQDWVKQKVLLIFGFTYRHAGATLGEVDHCGIELVFEEVSMGHHSPSQRQTGGSHQHCPHHLENRCRAWEGKKWQKVIQTKCEENCSLKRLKHSSMQVRRHLLGAWVLKLGCVISNTLPVLHKITVKIKVNIFLC